MGTNTELLHGYPVVDPYTGAASIPKYQTSTFNQQASGEHQEYSYTRFGNPTVSALEEAIKKLEHAAYGLAFSSGMAAISNVLMLLKAGDHAIFPHEVYGGTCQFAGEILPNYGIETSFIDMSSIEELEAAIQENTKLIYIETPSNPLLKVSDIKKIVQVAAKHKLLTVADNTFMTPLNQRPLDLGVDLVVESMTKFINGHSDVVAGLIATNDTRLYEKLYLFQKNFGGILGIEEAWLVLRGMKTLGLRMAKSVENAEKLAEFLSQHPKVSKVYYPSLAGHDNATVQKSQAKNGGAVLSFELKDEADLEKFIKNMKVPIYAVSLGGVETIISHPASMSHACLTAEERAEQGVTDGLLRMSCGIEDVEDLLADLEQALK
ncbi:trans-sulfuration enzyme family protein [Lactococcus termiticola]|uniref:Cystathionine beta-lyase n=1 Tax=Lactococcus termiticola TaxID=2169526 RepID=A0A2R5HHJ7_9LACT|nr:PLP-dependent aspartate aminotransferase family protein [Lactococcus termiticola]GBG97519.1 cystathionine beta-lyase [Lactococcus termiticola]